MTNVEKLELQVLTVKSLSISLGNLVDGLRELPDEVITPELVAKMYSDYIDGVQRHLVKNAGARGEEKFQSMESTLRNVTHALVEDFQPKH